MLRFIDKENVLIQGFYNDYDPPFKTKFFEALDRIGLKWKELDYEVENKNEKLNWAYLNFLQTKDVILVPQFNIEEDSIAIDKLNKIYTQYSPNQIIGIPMSEVVADGGALNCISWTILK